MTLAFNGNKVATTTFLTVRTPAMGKGLSELQRDILAALEQWPSYEEATATRRGYIGDWALPRDIIAALALPTSAATSAAISRALARLHARGLVARASGERASVGKAFRYVRITDPANAGAGVTAQRQG